MRKLADLRPQALVRISEASLILVLYLMFLLGVLITLGLMADMGALALNVV